jgi:hypothetical protein
MSEYLTSGQVAKKLGLSIATVQQWTKDGLVTPDFVTLGGRARWTVGNLLSQLGGDTHNVPQHDPGTHFRPVPAESSTRTC